MLDVKQPQTHAILCWFHRYNVPVQHYHKRCSHIDKTRKETNIILTSIFDIINHFQQKDKFVRPITATLKPFASGYDDCVLN